MSYTETGGYIGLRILIADDHAQFRDKLRGLVEMCPGWTVVSEVSDGAEAVAAAEKDRPDLIILDVNMPGLTGIEATAKIRTLLPSVPIILCTMHDAEPLRLLAKNAGADLVLGKVDLASTLVIAIAKLTAKKHSVAAPGLPQKDPRLTGNP